MRPLPLIFFAMKPGLPWWGISAPPSSKKQFVRGAQRALKIGQVLNCERLDFRAEILKLGGVSSDLMAERRYFQIAVFALGLKNHSLITLSVALKKDV